MKRAWISLLSLYCWMLIAGAVQATPPMARTQFIVKLAQPANEAKLAALMDQWSLKSGYALEAVNIDAQRIVFKINQSLTQSEIEHVTSVVKADSAVEYIEQDVLHYPKSDSMRVLPPKPVQL